MTTAVPRELEAVDAVFAAEQAVQRARRVVEEFQEVVTSALQVLDDAELDSAKSRLSDRCDFYLEAAAEHLGRLQPRVAILGEVVNLARPIAQLASDHVESAAKRAAKSPHPACSSRRPSSAASGPPAVSWTEPTRTYACWRPSSSARPARPTSRSGSPRRSPTTPASA